MVLLKLRSPLRELAGAGEVRLEASTVGEAIEGLEPDHPRLAGWVLDDRGGSVSTSTCSSTASGRTLDTPSAADDRITSCRRSPGVRCRLRGRDRRGRRDAWGAEPSCWSGPARGCSCLRGGRGGAMEIAARQFAANVVEFAMRDERSGRYFASVTHGVLRAAHLPHATTRWREWEAAEGPAFPEDAGRGGRPHVVHPQGRRAGRAVGRRRAGRAVQERGRRLDLAAERGPVERAVAAVLAARRRRAGAAFDLHLAGRPVAARDRDLGRGRVALRRRRVLVAPRQRGPGRPLPARGGARGRGRPVRAQHASDAARADDAVHAVPRRRLSLRRRRRVVGGHRHGHGAAVRLRLPDGRGPAPTPTTRT